MTKRTKNIIGQRFSRLLVTEFAETVNGISYWSCICDCGNTVKVRGAGLRNGHPKSCGCLQKEKALKHGMSHSPAYSTWEQMIQRCTNKDHDRYHDYGGRGITVCSEWTVFDNFHNDMGDRPEETSLDRIDNNKGYDKINCRWATSKQQNRNRRNNKLIEFNGKTLCVNEWAETLGINERTLLNRLSNGWPTEKAFIHPVRQLSKQGR